METNNENQSATAESVAYRRTVTVRIPSDIPTKDHASIHATAETLRDRWAGDRYGSREDATNDAAEGISRTGCGACLVAGAESVARVAPGAQQGLSDKHAHLMADLRQMCNLSDPEVVLAALAEVIDEDYSSYYAGFVRSAADGRCVMTAFDEMYRVRALTALAAASARGDSHITPELRAECKRLGIAHGYPDEPASVAPVAGQTDGTWEVLDDGQQWPQVVSAHMPDGSICTMADFDPQHEGNGDRSRARALAHAHIIASAPTLARQLAEAQTLNHQTIEAHTQFALKHARQVAEQAERIAALEGALGFAQREAEVITRRYALGSKANIVAGRIVDSCIRAALAGKEGGR